MTILIVLFFVISPIIIMYTSGYRYDFKTNQLKKTGVISISAAPNDAEIYLNNLYISQKLPLWLPNTAPGIYNVTIKKNGYWNWNKEITVESQQTTYLKNITLFKNSLPVEYYKLKKDDTVSFSNFGTGAIITDNLNHKINLLSFEKNNNLELLDTTDKENIEINWSPFYDLFYITYKTDKENNLRLIDINDPANFKTYQFDKDQTLDKQWSNRYPGLFIKTIEKNNQGKINFYSLTDARLIGQSKSKIWYVNGEAWHEKIWDFNPDKKEILLNTADATNTLSMPLTLDKIIDINDNRIIAKTNNQIEILIIENNKITNSFALPTNQVFYNFQTGEWLAYSEWELWNIQIDGQAVLLNRISEKINKVIPLDDYGVVLIATNNKVTAFNPGYYVSQELANNIDSNQLIVNKTNKQIYFQGTIGQTNAIFSLDY